MPNWLTVNHVMSKGATHPVENSREPISVNAMGGPENSAEIVKVKSVDLASDS
jgi:hypothetical protein